MTRSRIGVLLACVLTLASSALPAAAGYWPLRPTDAPAELLDGGTAIDTAVPPSASAAVSVQVPPLGATPLPAPQAASQITLTGPADPPSPIHVNGVLQYRLFTAPTPAAAGDVNLNVLTPTPQFPQVNDGIAEAAINATFSPTFSIFADLSLESTTGEVSPLASSDIEEAYFDLHNAFGLQGWGFRGGRDRVKLGVIGLLLDENVYDGGRRDGFEGRVTQVGPLSFFGFMQYSLDDGLQLFNWQSSRRVWGGSVAAQVGRGWTVDAAYRTDTAGPAEVGPCPGVGCNVGSGWSVSAEGNLTRGVDLTAEAATYTQLGDVARWYFEPSVAFDLQQLLGLSLQPLLTVWYKNFDPYTAPLDAPLGHELLPGFFSPFNTNDNLTAVGAELDLTVTPALLPFVAVERGAYKNAGPNYTVFSIGAAYNFTTDMVVKVSYNSYQVDTGVVTTSPVSGLQLSNTGIYVLELTKTF
jgi:hypothetical protein